MSVAQVLNMSGPAPDPGAAVPDEVANLTAATKALDGLEHIYVCGGAENGESMTILVWRDQAACQAATDHIAADNQTIGDLLGVKLSFGPLYQSFQEI